MVTEETLNKLFDYGLPKGVGRSQVKQHSIALTKEQKDRLMDYAPKGTNKKIVYDIAAWQMAHKNKVFSVAVRWLQWKGVGACQYYTQGQFSSMLETF